jgi:hypothetical protein
MKSVVRISTASLLVAVLTACGSDGVAGVDSAAGAGGVTIAGGAASDGGFGEQPSPEGQSGGCDEALLRTGLVAQQTGVSVDDFDCEILSAAEQYDEPDPMLIKAIIYVESRFDQTAVGCPNMPCGQPSGWTTEEAGCLGLMQIVPACGGTSKDVALLPDGHPNMTTDATSSDFAGSVFNPRINIQIGVAGIAGNRTEVEELFSGCTEEQYTLMAIGNYNRHGSTTSCTEINFEYVDVVLEAYAEYAAAAAYEPIEYSL